MLGAKTIRAQANISQRILAVGGDISLDDVFEAGQTTVKNGLAATLVFSLGLRSDGACLDVVVDQGCDAGADLGGAG